MQSKPRAVRGFLSGQEQRLYFALLAAGRWIVTTEEARNATLEEVRVPAHGRADGIRGRVLRA
ncbi:MAG TPA: hypothetical protein VI893_01265 [Thermoplasmata archaeon]|nr:hypothetical protein [Thermoplasmata archaeon]